MTARLKQLIFVVLSSCLFACSTSNSKNHDKTYVVEPSTLNKELTFSGTVEPIHETTITTPVDAIIENMHYRYGQPMNKNATVFTLNSAELQKQYNDTLTEYLKAKDSFSMAQVKFTGTEDLWHSGLISKNNYLSEKSSLNTMRITLMQATRKLSDMLEKTDDSFNKDIANLSFAEFDKVREALAGNHNLIHLKAPIKGVLLYPPKPSDGKDGHITVGSTVKANQVLALVGDLSGIRIEIEVPEVDIDKIKPGMKAKVHGIAFAKQELKGVLVAVNAQASATVGGTLPSFTAIVEVKKLNPTEQSWVKVGMSATIELVIASTNKLLIPIEALKQQYGKSVVEVENKKGVIETRAVVTGPARADTVVVESGLRVGDIIHYD